MNGAYLYGTDGALTGLSKKMIKQIYGEAQFKRWRRGYHEPPPPISSFSSSCESLHIHCNSFIHTYTIYIMKTYMYPNALALLLLLLLQTLVTTAATLSTCGTCPSPGSKPPSAPSHTAGWRCTETCPKQSRSRIVRTILYYTVLYWHYTIVSCILLYGTYHPTYPYQINHHSIYSLYRHGAHNSTLYAGDPARLAGSGQERADRVIRVSTAIVTVTYMCALDD